MSHFYSIRCIIVFLGILIILPQENLAQKLERPKKESMSISDPVSVLSNAKGWTLQDNGEWEGKRNLIPFKNNELNRSKKGPSKIGSDNFSKMELRQVILDNQAVHSVLIVYYTEGYYEYPKIQQNWKEFKAVRFNVFKEDILSRILSDGVKFNNPVALNLDLLCSGKIIDYNSKTYLFNIQNAIREALYSKKESIYTTILAVLPVEMKNNKTVRFKFIEVLNKVDVYAKYLRSVNWPKLFENSYYECNFDDFHDFISRVSPVESSKMNDLSYLKGFYTSGMKKIANGNYAGAVVDFTKALNSHSQELNRSELLLNRGIARYLGKDFQGSITDFTSIVSDSMTEKRHRNDWIKALYYRGLSYKENQNLTDACDDWNLAFNNGLAEAEKFIEKICKQKGYETKRFPKAFNFYMKKGMKKFESYQYDKAINYFIKAESKQPQNNYFSLYFYRGLANFHIANYSEAKKDLNIATGLKPNRYSKNYDIWPDTYIYLGMVCFYEKDTIKGCENILLAIENGSKSVDKYTIQKCTSVTKKNRFLADTTEFAANYENGIESFDDGNFFNTVLFFNIAEKLYPEHNNYLLYSFRGYAKHKTEDFKGAIIDFDKALLVGTSQNFSLLERATILFNRGVSKYFIEDEKGACEDWAKAINFGLEDEAALDFINKKCKELTSRD